MNKAKLFICVKRLISAPNVGLQTIKINIKNHFKLRKPSHRLDLCLNCKMPFHETLLYCKDAFLGNIWWRFENFTTRMWKPAIALGTTTWTLTRESHLTIWLFWAAAQALHFSPKENGILEDVPAPHSLHCLSSCCCVCLLGELLELLHTLPTGPPADPSPTPARADGAAAFGS